MTTETLVNEYTRDHSYKEIDDTLFVVCSSRIRYRVDFKNIIDSFLYSEKLMFALTGGSEDYEVVRREILGGDLKHLDLINRLIATALLEKTDIVLLCSPNEMKTGYLPLVAKVIEDYYHYPIINYQCDKKKDHYFNPSKVAKVINKTEEAIIDNMLQYEVNRRRALKAMSKKEMKKELKKMGLYSDEMRKSEMRDMLQVYFVERDG